MLTYELIWPPMQLTLDSLDNTHVCSLCSQFPMHRQTLAVLWFSKCFSSVSVVRHCSFDRQVTHLISKVKKRKEKVLTSFLTVWVNPKSHKVTLLHSSQWHTQTPFDSLFFNFTAFLAFLVFLNPCHALPECVCLKYFNHTAILSWCVLWPCWNIVFQPAYSNTKPE